MKRFEKYAGQLQLLQDAAFVIARRDGPQAITRRGLATELGSIDAMPRRVLSEQTALPVLVATECARRRRVSRHRRATIDLLLPGVDDVDLEVVWLRLRLGYGTVPAVEDGVDLPQRYQLVTRGWVDEDLAATTTTATARTQARAAGRAAEAAAVATYLDDREATTRTLVTELLPDRSDLVEPVLALVDGLVLGVCTGRLSAPAARAVLVEHLARLGLADAGGARGDQR